MTFEQFFTYWNGKACDIDKAFGNQCKDVFSAFNRDVVKAPYIVGNAGEIWFKDTSRYYNRFINTITAVPQKGDIMIWLPYKGNSFGHISVCYSANMFSFVSLDQNWPKQGYYDKNNNFIGTGVCHFQNHNYLWPKVVGWLRMK
jgi:hypothetical protein